jgi:hypothetical protein
MLCALRAQNVCLRRKEDGERIKQLKARERGKGEVLQWGDRCRTFGEGTGTETP